jgi:hypothetical protein
VRVRGMSTVWLVVWISATSSCGGQAGGSSDSPDEGSPADGSGPVTADASEAADASSSADASAPDAGAEAVTVHFLGRGLGPSPGVQVLFHGRDGILVGRTTTDAKGAASGNVPEGGSVTVVEVGSRRFTTTFGVEPGDDLMVGDLRPYLFPIQPATLSLPSGPEAENRYVALGPCGDGNGKSSPISVFLYANCRLPQPMVAIAFRPGSTLETGFIYDPMVNIEPGGTASIDGAWAPPISFTFRLTGIPAEIPAENVYLSVGRYAAGRLLFRSDDKPTAVVGGEVNESFEQASGGDGTLTTLELARLTGGRWFVVEYRDSVAENLEGNLAPDLIPMAEDRAVIEGQLDPEGPTGIVGVTFNMPKAGAYDGIVAEVIRVDAVTYNELYRWTIVSPPPSERSATLRFPDLPADLLPVWEQEESSYAWFFVTAADTQARSYADFRRDAEPNHPWNWMYAPAAPARIRISRAD